MATAGARGQNFAAIFSPASFQFSSSSVSSPLLQVAHFFGLARFPMSELRTFWFYQISHNPRLHFSPSIHPLPARWLCKLWQVSFQHFCTHLISKSIWWQVLWESGENIYIGFYLSMAINPFCLIYIFRFVVCKLQYVSTRWLTLHMCLLSSLVLL